MSRAVEHKGCVRTLTISLLYHLALNRSMTALVSLPGGISRFITYFFHLSSPSKSKALFK